MKNITLLAFLFVCLFVQTTFAQSVNNASSEEISDSNERLPAPISDEVALQLYKTIKKPTNLQELYNNTLIIKKNYLLFRHDFFTDINIMNFLGCKEVIWASNGNGSKKATLIYSDDIKSYVGMHVPQKLYERIGLDEKYQNTHLHGNIMLWTNKDLSIKLKILFQSALKSNDDKKIMPTKDLSFISYGYLFYENHDIYQPLDDIDFSDSIEPISIKNNMDLLKNLKLALSKNLFFTSSFYSPRVFKRFFSDDAHDFDSETYKSLHTLPSKNQIEYEVKNIHAANGRIRMSINKLSGKKFDVLIEFLGGNQNIEDVEDVFGYNWLLPIFGEGVMFSGGFSQYADRNIQFNPLSGNGMKYLFYNSKSMIKIILNFDNSGSLSIIQFQQELKQ